MTYIRIPPAKRRPILTLGITDFSADNHSAKMNLYVIAKMELQAATDTQLVAGIEAANELMALLRSRRTPR